MSKISKLTERQKEELSKIEAYKKEPRILLEDYIKKRWGKKGLE